MRKLFRKLVELTVGKRLITVHDGVPVRRLSRLFSEQINKRKALVGQNRVFIEVFVVRQVGFIAQRNFFKPSARKETFDRGNHELCKLLDCLLCV